MTKIPFYKTFASQKQKIHFVREDSHLQQTLHSIQSILGVQKLDFLFINGDHTYEGVKKDFEMYSSLVKKGGLIGFHDICVSAAGSGCEVSKLWKTLKNKYNYKEIIENPKQGWAGIGLIYT